MKKLLVTLCATAVAFSSFAQGVVKFANTSTSKIQVVPAGGGAAVDMPTPAGGYYFGLFTAASGTTDPNAFTAFAGIYATNSVAGRLQGGPNTGVNASGWAPGAEKAFLVKGWSANWGADWTTASANITKALAAQNSTAGWYGISGIGTGIAGGDTGTGTLPALNLWGASPALTAGFTMNYYPVVPEPSTIALAGLGLASLLVFRRRK